MEAKHPAWRSTRLALFFFSLELEAGIVVLTSSLPLSTLQPEILQGFREPPSPLFWRKLNIINTSNTIDCDEDGCLNRGTVMRTK